MKITFQTKEESNQKQRELFLKLSPSERVQSFYKMMERLKDFPTKSKEQKDNFVITIYE